MPRNRMRIPILSAAAALAVSLGCLLSISTIARAQNSAQTDAQNSFDLAIHANSDVSPADIGLPAYPGATPSHKHGDDKAAFDIGFSYGDTHFRMRGISYDSDDSPSRILHFYRKALGRYGDVLECDHGRPVGSLTVTSSGLRCSDRKNGDHLNIDGHIDSSKDHDLRAGAPGEFRIVGINESESQSARFVIMYVKTPTDAGDK